MKKWSIKYDQANANLSSESPWTTDHCNLKGEYWRGTLSLSGLFHTLFPKGILVVLLTEGLLPQSVSGQLCWSTVSEWLM